MFLAGFWNWIRMFLPRPDPESHKFADPDPGQKGKERNE